MHIAIEGIDGVGKSTAAKNLAKKLGFILVEKPLHFLFDENQTEDNYIRIRNQVNKSKNMKFTGWFYGLGNIFLYEHFKDENIITDRHILSNYCWSGSEETDYIFDAIYKTTGSPDMTFLIYADPNVVRERLKKRDPNDPDLKKVDYIPTAYANMKRVLDKYNMPGLIIDTTNLNEEQVVDLMIDELIKRGVIDGFKNKDTLFIDMKYIILYRKLGFDEISQDVFVYHYFDTSITIYSEEQRFEYLGVSYKLLEYKDFSLIECIDRLLKKGYKSSLIKVNYKKYDLAILNEDNSLYCGIYCEGWGKKYKELTARYVRNNNIIECLYTSQLSGGLIDFISEIHADDTYLIGIFENDSKLYNTFFTNPKSSTNYSKEFLVKNDELVKYIGKDKKVVIPNGIRRIGTGAFWNNNLLEEVVIPNTVTCICGDAFVYCENLKLVNIPISVIEMGDDPFAGCINVHIDCNSSSFVNEDGVIFDKDKKFLIHYTAGKTALEYVVPESVTWIGKHSFYKCENLEKVTITKNVKFMGNNAFSDCHKIHLVNESLYFQYVDGVLYDKNATICMHYSMGSGVKEVHLLNTVRTIGRNCFWNCDMIEKIIIPESVRQIGYNPFANCKNVVIENHSPFYNVVDGILYDASISEMVYCPPLAAKGKEIIVPKTVVNIGRSAFTGCDTLEKITLPEGLKFISRSSFSGCTKLKEIIIPSSVEDIADWCFNGCISLKKVIVPKHIVFQQNTFANCPAEIERV